MGPKKQIKKKVIFPNGIIFGGQSSLGLCLMRWTIENSQVEMSFTMKILSGVILGCPMW